MTQQAGATGNFPDGKISEDDEGELYFKMIIDKDKNILIVDFGKSVKWIGLDKLTLKELIERFLQAYAQLK